MKRPKQRQLLPKITYSTFNDHILPLCSTGGQHIQMPPRSLYLTLVKAYYNMFFNSPILACKRLPPLTDYSRLHVAKILVPAIFCFCTICGHAQEVDTWEDSVSITTIKSPKRIYTHVAHTFRSISNLISNANIFDALVDKRGYTWFSNPGGLSRYDGYEFKSYGYEEGLEERLTIRSYEDYKGRIWFTSISGKLSYFENNRIHPYEYNSLLSPYINKDMMASMHIDSNNTLHIGTYASGYITVSDKGELRKVITDSIHLGIGVILVNDTVPLCFTNGLFEDQNQVTLFTKEAEKTLDFSIEETRPSLKYTKTVRCILLKDGTLLLSYEHQVARFKKSSGQEGIYQFSENVIALNEDAYGGIWIGTFGQGAYQYPKGLLQNKEPIHYFQNSKITSIRNDLENGIWFTSMHSGVSYMPNPYLSSTKMSNLLETSPYAKDQVKWPSTRNQEFYVLTRAGFLMYSDGPYLRTIDLPKTLQSKDETFWSLYLPPNETSIWISSSNNYFKLTGNSIRSPENETDIPLTGKTYSRGFTSPDSSFWWSKYNRIFKIRGTTVEKILKLNSDVRSIKETADGTLWIGTINGLWKYENDSLLYLGASDSLLTNRILYMAEFAGSLWMANEKHGLILLKDYQHSSSVTWKGEKIKEPRAFYTKDNALWFISDGHLNKLSVDSNETDSIKIESLDLPRVLWGGKNTMLMEWLGKLTIIGYSGLYQFEFIPEFSSVREIPLHINQVKVNNRDTLLLPEFSLSYKQDHVSIKYVAITNLEAKDTKYKYRIKGVDPGWIETSDRQVQYTSLPTGTHIFELFAKPMHGAWTKKPVTISFTIAPPYWETWWFIALCILAVLALLWTAAAYRFRRLRAENSLQMALNESQQQALSARMNPHFIFNALNSIKTFVLENDTVQSNDYIARFSKLMRQILDQSQYTLIPLEDELKALDNYVSLELMRGKDRFSYSIHVDAHIDQKRVKVPSLLLQPFVENAIWHGVMPLNRPGHISVSLHRKAHEILCTIEDDGVGRTKTSSDEHVPASTQISNKRLDLINKRFRTRIQIQIEDILDEQGAVLGTKVLIPIPIEFKN